MELSGTWRALIADDDLRRTWLDDARPDGSTGDFDDRAWEPIEVPGHWRSTPAFADTDGPLLYRTRFEHGAPAADDRLWLVLDGLFYQGDVWLDGAYIGDTEGYFAPHQFEVTEALHRRTEHVLGIEATCGRPSDRTAKRNITGVFQHWDCLDPDWNPGGLWRPVRLERSGPVRIRHWRILCREAGAEQALLTVRAVLDAAGRTTASLRTTLDGFEHVEERTLAAGENQVTWTVTIPRPRLWWPWAMGDQPRYDARLEVRLPDATVSDHRQVRTGLRQITMHDWILSVNGERLFVKGANLGPTRMQLAQATPKELAADVDLAKEAGLDLVRVHAHISRPELYQAADEAGMLIWQDFPLQWGYARGIRKQAVTQAREAVDLLAHHPSIAVWCGHNEPIALDIEPGGDFDMSTLARRVFVAQQLPTWNKTVLDRSVKRTFEKEDGTRPVVAHSGVFPHPPQFDGTDSHLYFGWYHGEERDFAGFIRAWPRMARFVTEFGAQAVPPTADFMQPERWPDLDWERLGRTHGLQRRFFDEHVPPADFATFDAWGEATQAYQATLIRHHIEALRRLKYRPTGGFAMFMLVDGHPAVTWSVLDHERAPKVGYAALKAACRPVIVVADRLPAEVAPGDALALDVHIVSDLRAPIDGRVTARLSWPGGDHTWRFGGAVAADSCERVGTLQFVVPELDGIAAGPGPSDVLRLDLDLDAGPHSITNGYEATILPTPVTP